MAFHLGSLGFLTPFEFDNFQEQVTNVLEGKFSCPIKNVYQVINNKFIVNRTCCFDSSKPTSLFNCSKE